MNASEYARKFSGGYARNGQSVTVPANIERREYHEPCFLCGQARGCKHRSAA